MRINLRSLKKSFQYAAKGLKYAAVHEQNFRIQLAMAVVVIVLMGLVGVKQWEAVALIFVIVAVLIVELVNTVLEQFLDLLKPRMHPYSEIIKDMMAAAVLLSSLGSLAVGIIIFYPYLIDWIL
jgi:diacylglycerol kinase